MGRTVRELLTSMSAAELQHWIAYAELDPWDEQRADLRAAQVTAMLLSVNTGKWHPPSDFLPRYGPASTEPMDDDQLLLMGMKLAAMGGSRT
jgi:hypothetical protein